MDGKKCRGRIFIWVTSRKTHTLQILLELIWILITVKKNTQKNQKPNKETFFEIIIVY